MPKHSPLPRSLRRPLTRRARKRILIRLLQRNIRLHQDIILILIRMELIIRPDSRSRHLPMIPPLRSGIQARFKDSREEAGEEGAERGERPADYADGEFDSGPHCGARVVPGYVVGDGDEVNVVEAEDGGYARASSAISVDRV